MDTPEPLARASPERAAAPGAMACAGPAIEIRTSRPAGADSAAWRAEPFARGVHSRLEADLRAPDEDLDPEHAEALCAAMTRERLGDFAPALLLLPGTERRRVRALLAYASVLFDFARQRGLEGERLAQINRWEYALETALAGKPAGQPLLLRMAAEEQRRRWPVDALDELASCARRRAVRERAATAAEGEAEARNLARAVAAALLEDRINAEVTGFGGALIRLHALQHLCDGAAQRRWPFPEQEWPDEAASSNPPGTSSGPPADLLATAVQRECARLRPRLLRAPRGLADLPTPYRRAGVFCLLAALRLLSEMEEEETRLLSSPPRLAPTARIALLLRARWFGPHSGLA